jgi:hypothetical protein
LALTDDLISYWKLDEASGNALDAHGSNDLTDNNTVGTAAGKISNARDFDRASSERLTRADNASISAGDVDFTFSLWFKAESLNNFSYLLSKRNAFFNDYELFYLSSSVYFECAGVTRQSSGVTVGAGEWHFVVFYHDSAANVIGVSIDGGAAVTTSTGGAAPSDTDGTFALGGRGHTGADYWDGCLDEVGFWKRVLTSDERTQLYNGGSGLAYEDFGGGGEEEADGSSAGSSTVTGLGASTATSSGSSAGAATPSATGSSTAQSAGSSDGTATPSAAGTSTAQSSGSSAGTSTASAAGQGSSVGTSDGTSTAQATGASTAQSASTSEGLSTAVATGSSTASSAGASEGLSAASGTAASTWASSGSSAGLATPSGVAVSTKTAAGTSTGLAACAATSTAEAPSGPTHRFALAIGPRSLSFSLPLRRRYP